MSWRTVVISTRCKLDLKLGYMVIRGEETRRVYLDEIAMLIVENPAVAMTGCLLQELAEKKIRVIFCTNKRSPYAELAPYYGSHDCSRKMKLQTGWSPEAKANVWKSIIGMKLRLQAEHLQERGKQKEAELIKGYIPNIEPGDTTNREGHAAKVYFNAIFGMEFKRGTDTPVNAALNYGYGIILAAFNRAITAMGYSTLLGIHHDNIYNFYNLSSDIMEPYRILVDRKILTLDFQQFEKETRYALVDILNDTVIIDGMAQTVLNSIEIYARSVINALLTEDVNVIKYYCL